MENDINCCPKCNTKQDCQYTMEVSTQTDDINGWLSIKSEDIAPEETIIKNENGEKRRRKRKRNCPKVVKTAQHSSCVPVLKQEPIDLQNKVIEQQQQTPCKLKRMDSNDDAFSFLENYNLDIDLEEKLLNPPNNLETIKEQMKIEWETCDTFSGGYLPIHEAIIDNELHKLKRQLYVWKFRRWNLMTLVTEYNDNPIQLAVKENCIKSIIEELLKENFNLDDNFDDECNNIIHLAVSHLSSDGKGGQQKKMLQTLELLLNKVDLAKILLQKNDDGLTPLHLAVKRNEYLMVEKILSVLDERLNLSNSVASLNDPCADVKTFLCHYCRQCDSLEGRATNDLKQDILNATDMKRGCSVLYFAMEMGYEHLVYLLLAHMCNPTIKNLAGLDAKTYYTETGKNASIIGILEKLPSLLQTTKQD